jgi:hypothetical protein
MPTNEDFRRSYLEGPARDPRTGALPDEAEPLTDEDRRLRRLNERERWVVAISTPPPGAYESS